MNELIYLIGRAPSVPDWFVPEMEEGCPALPEFHAKLSALEQGTLLASAHNIQWAEMLVSVDTRRAIRDTPRAVEAYQEYSAWRTCYAEQRDLQWPLYWATQMMERATHDAKRTDNRPQ